MGEITSIKLPKKLVERLKALKRPHQAMAGVIEELLEQKGNTEKEGNKNPDVYQNTKKGL